MRRIGEFDHSSDTEQRFANDHGSIALIHPYMRFLAEGDASAQVDCSDQKQCSKCVPVEECRWCGRVTRGYCQSIDDDCHNQIITDYSQCPAIETSAMLRNVVGLLGALLAVAIFLNIVNRMQNRRRRNKLHNSIFTIPTYTYPSAERRAVALKEARERWRGFSGTNVAGEAKEGNDQREHGDMEDGHMETESGQAASCTICLAAYEEEQVIKVLPCGHEFHSDCLDSWLKLKPMCPLCKAPAFGDWNGWARQGRSVHTRSSSDATAVSIPESQQRSGSLANPRLIGFFRRRLSWRRGRAAAASVRNRSNIEHRCRESGSTASSRCSSDGDSFRHNISSEENPSAYELADTPNIRRLDLGERRPSEVHVHSSINRADTTPEGRIGDHPSDVKGQACDDNVDGMQPDAD